MIFALLEVDHYKVNVFLFLCVLTLGFIRPALSQSLEHKKEVETKGWITDLTLSNNGDYLVLGSGLDTDKTPTAMFWNLQRNKRLGSSSFGRTGTEMLTDFSESRKEFLAVSSDGVLSTLQVRQDNITRSFRVFTSVNDVEFIRDDFIITADSEKIKENNERFYGSVKVYSYKSKSLVQKFKTVGENLDIELHPDKPVVISASVYDIRFWNINEASFTNKNVDIKSECSEGNPDRLESREVEYDNNGDHIVVSFRLLKDDGYLLCALNSSNYSREYYKRVERIGDLDFNGDGFLSYASEKRKPRDDQKISVIDSSTWSVVDTIKLDGFSKSIGFSGEILVSNHNGNVNIFSFE